MVSGRIGEPISISTLLFSALDLSLEVAHLTGGALDPTVGRAMEHAGFNTNYLTGEQVTSPAFADSSANYRDIVLDHDEQRISGVRTVGYGLNHLAQC